MRGLLMKNWCKSSMGHISQFGSEKVVSGCNWRQTWDEKKSVWWITLTAHSHLKDVFVFVYTHCIHTPLFLFLLWTLFVILSPLTTRWTLPWFTLSAASLLVSWHSPTPASTRLPFTCWARPSRSNLINNFVAAAVWSWDTPRRARLIITHGWPLSAAHITPWRVWAWSMAYGCTPLIMRTRRTAFKWSDWRYHSLSQINHQWCTVLCCLISACIESYCFHWTWYRKWCQWKDFSSVNGIISVKLDLVRRPRHLKELKSAFNEVW